MRMLGDYFAARKRALFLDFDGTLVLHADRPDAIEPSDKLVPLLNALAKNTSTIVGVVSGRSLRDLRMYLTDTKTVLLSGNHGLEWQNRQNEDEAVKLPPTYYAKLRSFRKDIDTFLSTYPKAHVEWKTCTLSVHLRGVNKKEASFIRTWIDKAAEAKHPGVFHVLHGAFDADIRPAKTWTKADVVEKTLKKYDIVAESLIYIGDDATDEDVFARFGKSITIKVGSGKTLARYRLASVSDVLKFLEKLKKNI